MDTIAEQGPAPSSQQDENGPFESPFHAWAPMGPTPLPQAADGAACGYEMSAEEP